MATSTGLSEVAAHGFQNAGFYDAHRPSFPAEAVDKLLRHLKVPSSSSSNTHIVEIGAGTGKFTVALSQAAEAAATAAVSDHYATTPWQIIAVEPHDQMRAQLAAKGLPHVQVTAGHASELKSVADGWADAVVIAQAFHWFANLDTIHEIRRVLKPNGYVGVIWNAENYNKPAAWPASTKWEQRLNDLVLSLPDDGHPRFRDEKWQAAFVKAAAEDQKLLSPLQDDRAQWTVQLTPDLLWKRLATLSHIAGLPENEEGEAEQGHGHDRTPTSRSEIQRRLAAILQDGPDVERDSQRQVTVHGTTYFAWAQRI